MAGYGDPALQFICIRETYLKVYKEAEESWRLRTSNRARAFAVLRFGIQGQGRKSGSTTSEQHTKYTSPGKRYASRPAAKCR